MLRYFCPNCWSDFAEDLAICPRCGVDIHAFWDSKNIAEKLVLALDHPEPETPIRAAWILGERREAGAAQALAVLVRRTRDVYVATAAVEALGKIGTPEAMGFLRTLSVYPARMVREAAREILRQHEAEPQLHEGQEDQG
jgi:HEAT repeat protein